MLYDAHNHLQDERLDPWRDEIITTARQIGVAEMIVNGTCEQDWPHVAALARAHPWIRPSFGLHPWHVKARSADWLALLRHALENDPRAGVGEVGIDRWMKNADMETQILCFRMQVALAVELDRPLSIHCLRAFGLLEETLRSLPLPPRGFLLHSYGGPAEMIPRFAALGGHFSLSPYFGHPRKAAQLAVFKEVPLDRLLVETDAPDMHPPDALNAHPLKTTEGITLNHPANLRLSYELLARIRSLPMADLEPQIAANHRAFFSP